MSSRTDVWLGASTKELIQSRTGYRRRKFTNTLMLAVTALFTLAALAILFWIIIYVVIKGLQYLNLDFFIHLPRPLGMLGGGVLNAIEGTIILTVMASVIAVIPGILAAYYVSYNPNTPLGVAVRFGTDVLSGVPSIIIGLFCYALIVKYQGHYSALAGVKTGPRRGS
jgi:phosphate transport system permease protein